MRLLKLIPFVLLLGCPLANLLAAEREQPPHIIVLLADDLGWGDVSYHDGVIQTPHIDALAERGTDLTQFYTQPVCSPTRASFMTGRYPMRMGLQCGVIRPWATETHALPLDEQTLPEELKKVGYRTAVVGKWHLGHATPDYLPLQRGFDQQYGHYNGMIEYFTHDREGGHDWFSNESPVKEEGYATDLMGAAAVRMIEEHDPNHPLFLYVPFNAPHTPLQVPEDQIARNAHIVDPDRRIFAGMVTSMDDAIGKIVAAANTHLDRQNTLIFFFSDNGGWERYSSNGKFRGEKTNIYEGGIRVPAIMVWDGEVPANETVDEPLHVVDVYPTLLKLAGASPRQIKPLDGKDVWPTVRDGAPTPHELIVHNVTPFHGAIRVGDWKLVRNGYNPAHTVTSMGEETWELFNMRDDPSESRNLVSAEPEIFQKLRTQLFQIAGEAVAPHIASNTMPPDFEVPTIWGPASSK
ncbi:MAG: arylsulfatase [Synoicihabitans sp.]